MASRKLRHVVVADAHTLERLGLLAVLKQTFSCAEFDVAAHFTELAGLLDDSTELAVVDGDLPGLTSLENLRHLKLDHPTTKFVLVSTTCTSSTVFAGLTAGAHGIVDKTLGAVEMAAAFRQVSMGHVYVPPQVCDGRSTGNMEAAEQHSSRADRLSTRQRQVLELACEGISNKEIARKLAISEATVKVHAGAAYRVIGATNRTHAAAVFRRHRLSDTTVAPRYRDATGGEQFMLYDWDQALN